MPQPLESVLDDLGRRLAELRGRRRWTQSVAAEFAGMAEKDYQAIENGRRAVTLRTLVNLANAFDVSVRELLDAPQTRVPRRPGRPPTPVAPTAAPIAAEPGGLKRQRARSTKRRSGRSG